MNILCGISPAGWVHVTEGGSSGRPPSFTVYVRMNGVIVTPKFDKSDFLKEWGLMQDDEQ